MYIQDNYMLPLPVGSFMGSTWSTQTTANTQLAARSDKQKLLEK